MKLVKKQKREQEQKQKAVQEIMEQWTRQREIEYRQVILKVSNEIWNR